MNKNNKVKVLNLELIIRQNNEIFCSRIDIALYKNSEFGLIICKSMYYSYFEKTTISTLLRKVLPKMISVKTRMKDAKNE
jgi:hypothetical protein